MSMPTDSNQLNNLFFFSVTQRGKWTEYESADTD